MEDRDTLTQLIEKIAGYADTGSSKDTLLYAQAANELAQARAAIMMADLQQKMSGTR